MQSEILPSWTFLAKDIGSPHGTSMGLWERSGPSAGIPVLRPNNDEPT
jgi:hypothetical protein